MQVQIVKKSNKWECKMCGEKQSVKQVYGRGSGKDCRAHVQKLNELRLKKEEFIDPSLENCNYQNNECAFQSVDLEDGSLATKLCQQTPKLSNESDEPSYPMKRNSKWSEFLASGSSTSSDDDDDAMDQSHFKPHRGDNSRKIIKKQKIASRHGEQFKLENKWNNFASNASIVAFTLDLIVAGTGGSVSSAVARCFSIDSAMPFAFSKGGRFSSRWHRSCCRSLVSSSTFTRAVVMGVVVMGRSFCIKVEFNCFLLFIAFLRVCRVGSLLSVKFCELIISFCLLLNNFIFLVHI
uniref:MRN complex-interacting protein N-terminal domain-containing protein n=1 Tax=Timema shepardi TaxID=629360 RepID=A0A7R9FZU1_TIMSH|nr:unnamed protein product [Timema shepardi]